MTPEGGQEGGSGNSEFVVVANRLPVDLERLPDGTHGGSAAPAGSSPRWSRSCATAAARGSAGRASPTPTSSPIDDDGMHLARCRCPPRTSTTTTRASPTRRCGRSTTTWSSAGVPSRVVGRLRRGQPALRRGHRQGRGRGRDGVGPGLPAAAGPEDAADAAARPEHRLLPAHPVPAGRAVHAAAVADRDRRGPARRRPGRVPPARRRAELPVLARRLAGANASRATVGVRSRSGRCNVGFRTVKVGAFPISIDSTALDQQARTAPSGSGHARSAASSATRARSCSASTGSTTPRASTFGCGRFRSCSPSIGPSATTPCWCSSRRPAGSASRATSRCARTSSARSATSTASTARSAIRSCTTCTGRCPATS